MLILAAKYPYKVGWKRLLFHLKDGDTEAQKDEAVQGPQLITSRVTHRIQAP